MVASLEGEALLSWQQETAQHTPSYALPTNQPLFKGKVIGELESGFQVPSSMSPDGSCEPQFAEKEGTSCPASLSV